MSIKKCVTEVFSRVTGYFSPVKQWNPGKGVKGEFADRKTYKTLKREVEGTNDEETPDQSEA